MDEKERVEERGAKDGVVGETAVEEAPKLLLSRRVSMKGCFCCFLFSILSL